MIWNLNSTPRKCLGYPTPIEAFAAQLGGALEMRVQRAPGGLSYWDVVNLIDGAAERRRLVGFDVAEFMPDRDVDGIGALNIARIIANMVRIAARS